MKLIMENWRNYLSESVDDATLMNQFALAINDMLAPQKVEFVLYRMPSPDRKRIEVVGVCTMNLTREPCIEPTYQISIIARKMVDEYRGLGMTLYKIAAAISKERGGGGITSDHENSSSIAAYKTWQKIDKSSEFERRKTKAGNAKFDYKDKTPDEDDDCEDIPEDYFVAAADYSYGIKQIPSFYKKLIFNHKEFGKKITAAQKRDYRAQRTTFFPDQYKDAKVLTKDYFKTSNKIIAAFDKILKMIGLSK